MNICRMQDMLLQLTKKLESVDTQIQTISAPPQPSTLALPSDSHLQKKVEETTALEAAECQKSPEEVNRSYLSSLTIKEVHMSTSYLEVNNFIALYVS